jgi:hypothetical protein
VAQVNDNLQVVVLNTNFHNDENYWMWLDQGDIAGMFAWFEELLAQQRAAGQR